MNVRERIMKIRIIEKMKETELKEYSDKLGIKDVSYMRDTKIGDPGIRKARQKDGEDNDHEHINVGNNLLGDQGSFPFFMGAAQTNSRFTVIPGFSCSSDDPADRWIHSFDAYPFWDVFCRSTVVQAWKRDLKIESRRKVLI